MARKLKLLSDAHWEKIAPLLPVPEQSKKGGRKFIPKRPCFEGILWVLWIGAPGRLYRMHTPVPRPAGGDSSAGRKTGPG